MADFSKSFPFLPKGHWPGPRSLATTNGVSFDVLSSGYLDVSVPRVSSLSGDLTVGFPHSEILGSKLIRSSPRLIAAYYVLHRLHTPRHPLDALKTLDRSHYQCPQYHQPHPLLSSGTASIIGLMFLYPTHHCIGLIGQIKKTRIHVRPLFLPEGVGSNRQCRISLRCPNIRSWTPRGINITKPCSYLTRLCTWSRSTGNPRSKSIPNKVWWWSQTGSNRRHPACKAGALPAELWPHHGCHQLKDMVGPGRLELPTSRLSGVRSNHLSYRPECQAAFSG